MPLTGTSAYQTVASKDGTTIGYRQSGHGPGLVLVHGAGQTSRDFERLAAALADTFTVYAVDRRGCGSSGPPGNEYGIRKEVEDLDAVLKPTDTYNVFGLSSGAVISLKAAQDLRTIRKVARYEPPLSINHSTPVDWVRHYDREVSEGKLGSAIITAMRGTQTAPPIFRYLPRFILDPVLNFLASRKPGDPDRAHQRGSGNTVLVV